MHLRACNAPRGPVALVGEGLGPPDTPHIPQRPLRTINETEIGASCAGDVAPLKRRGPEPRGGHMHVPRRCALRPVGARVQCLRLHHVLPIRRGT